MPSYYQLSETAVTRIQNALDYIHQNPSEWNQGSWIVFIDPDGNPTGTIKKSELPACGTAACLAGRIALQSGVKHSDATSGWVYADLITIDGVERSVEGYVKELLFEDSSSNFGYQYEMDYYDLTSSENTEENLWYYGQFMTDNRLTVPEGIEPSPFEVEEEDVSF